MSEKTVSVVFRVDEDLKNAFERAAKARDRTVSQLLRDFMRHHVEWFSKNHAQGDLLEAATPSEATKPPRTPPKKKNAPKPAGSSLLNALIQRDK
jgi:hypothetical protein